jgi:hypothetical protein
MSGSEIISYEIQAVTHRVGEGFGENYLLSRQGVAGN